MTLREAVDRAEESFRGHIEGMWSEDEVEAFRLVIDTARQHMDDTAEIVLPCATCGGRGQIVHSWVGDQAGYSAVSPCPTCCKTPVPSPGQE